MSAQRKLTDAGVCIADIAQAVVDLIAPEIAKQSRAILKSHQDTIDALRAALKASNDKVAALEAAYTRKFEEIDREQRVNNIRILGVDEAPEEDLEKTVIDLARQNLGIELCNRDFDRCFRVGKPAPGAKRAILVRFSSYRTRSRVFAAKTRLKGSKIVVKEDLSPHNYQMLRRAMDKHGPRNVWSSDGRIFVRTGEDKSVIRYSEDI
jgi:hypothetical protein